MTRDPHRLALALAWLVTTSVVGIMLVQGVRSTDRYDDIRYLMHVVYVAALLVALSRRSPSTGPSPDPIPEILKRRPFWAWGAVVGVALALLLMIGSDEGLDVLVLLLATATVWILVVWRVRIPGRAVAQGLALALIAYVTGLVSAANGAIRPGTLVLLSAFVAPMYVAGGLLAERTTLGGVQLWASQYRRAFASFVRGCLLFVPLGLINAADGSPGTGFTWVSEWWMPVWLPWFSAIAEEVWFRLLLVGVCYLLLRPAFRSHPAVAVVAAVLLSGIMFGLAHGRTVERFVTTGLLYGVPLATVFARRDWEHAVGAHYMINMIPWTMAFLEA